MRTARRRSPSTWRRKAGAGRRCRIECATGLFLASGIGARRFRSSICADCGIVPVPEDQLPVVLPEDAEFLPTGESPLKYHEGSATRLAQNVATRTPNVRRTRWIRLSTRRGTSSAIRARTRDDTAFDSTEMARWAPVDLYTGGAEHAVMHLLYARFFHQCAA